MKQILVYVLVVALLFAVCFLIVNSRQQRSSAQSPVQTQTPDSASARPTDTGASGTPSPASGSDLFLPEPFSAQAQTALDDLRREMQTQHCVCAVAPLGAVDPELPLAEQLEDGWLLQALAEAYPDYAFLPELTPMHCAPGGGELLYYVLPLGEGNDVQVRAGDRIYRTEQGAPLLFTADSADVLLELLTTDGEPLEYSYGYRIGCELQPPAGPVLFYRIKTEAGLS